jgi:alkylation response protein AidB-like acyl-CoA dehydrogenase
MTDDSEIISLLKDSAQHFIQASAEANSSAQKQTPSALLASMAELGWPGLALSEAKGGSGLGLQAITALTNLFGESALTTPFIGQCILPSILLNHAPDNDFVAMLCNQLNSAEQALAFAWQEQVGQLPSSKSLSVVENGVLNGSKCFVAGASYAQHFLISATIDNQSCLIALDKDAEGISIKTSFNSDMGFADIQLKNVAIAPDAIILQGENADAAINAALNTAQIAVAAQLSGLANGCLEQTLEYIKTRSQFKQLLGSFQAIRHRCADLFMSNKLADSSWQRAVREYGNGSNDLTEQQIHAAKARCADAAFKVAKESIQMHGAMGFTEEAGIGHYMRAAIGLSSWLGSAQQHRHQLMLSSLEEA